MRRLTPLVLILAACTSTAGDTTTSAPLAELSTTTSTAAPTTTTTKEPTTTTEVEECVDRGGDGVLRTSRGFVCPPHLPTILRQSNPVPLVHLPGRYTTRLFQPGLAFTRSAPFQTDGETEDLITFDFPPNREVSAYSGILGVLLAELPSLTPLNRPEEFQWRRNVSTQNVQIDGAGGQRTTYDVACAYEDRLEHCDFVLEGMERFTQLDGDRVAIIHINSAPPITIMVEAPAEVFDAYWTEVAQPILDSIEFLDQ